MSLKKLYFEKGKKMCLTCMYIDEYAFNVRGEGKIPHGYDGSAECGKFDDTKEESFDNRWMISPMWKPCCKYKQCTKEQVEYKEIFDIDSQTIIKNPHKIYFE